MSPDMRRFKEPRAKNPQRGFTLIEVLLAHVQVLLHLLVVNVIGWIDVCIAVSLNHEVVKFLVF